MNIPGQSSSYPNESIELGVGPAILRAPLKDAARIGPPARFRSRHGFHGVILCFFPHEQFADKHPFCSDGSLDP